MAPLYAHKHITMDGVTCRECTYLGTKKIDNDYHDFYQCHEQGSVSFMCQSGTRRDSEYAMLTVADRNRRPEASMGGVWSFLKKLADKYAAREEERRQKDKSSVAEYTSEEEP
jgi:hypothetical protein